MGGFSVHLRAAALTAAIVVQAVAGAAGIPDPNASFPGSGAEPFQAGFAQCSPLSSVTAVRERIPGIQLDRGRFADRHYNIHEETFQAYVPGDYDPNRSYGLLVAIAPGREGISAWPALRPILDRRGMLMISADGCGNPTHVYARRIPLALDGAWNMQQRYNIDPDRIYISGVSGGGRVASVAAFHYPDVFSGGIFMIGAGCWHDVRVPGQRNRVWKGFPKPQTQYMVRARNYGRYVMITGDDDFNRPSMQGFFEKGYKPYLKHCLYLQVPGMGHDIPPVEWINRALQFVDDPKPRPPQPGRASR